MEMWTVAHERLRNFAADFWESQLDSKRILDQIGVSPGAVDMTPPAIMRWYSIIRHLMRLDDGSMGRLVITLMAEYPENDSLRKVCEPWIPVEPAKMARVLKLPEPVPVVAPPDYAEEAPDVVPKLDTLWQTVIDQDKRLAQQEKWLVEMDQWARSYPFGKLPEPLPEKNDKPGPVEGAEEA